MPGEVVALRHLPPAEPGGVSLLLLERLQKCMSAATRPKDSLSLSRVGSLFLLERLQNAARLPGSKGRTGTESQSQPWQEVPNTC